MTPYAGLANWADGFMRDLESVVAPKLTDSLHKQLVLRWVSGPRPDSPEDADDGRDTLMAAELTDKLTE